MQAGERRVWRGKRLSPPNTSRLNRKGVNGHVGEIKCGNAVKGLPPAIRGYAGKSGDEVDAGVRKYAAGDFQRLQCLAYRVAAIATSQNGVVKRLDTEAEAGDAEIR